MQPCCKCWQGPYTGAMQWLLAILTLSQLGLAQWLTWHQATAHSHPVAAHAGLEADHADHDHDHDDHHHGGDDGQLQPAGEDDCTDCALSDDFVRTVIHAPQLPWALPERVAADGLILRGYQAIVLAANTTALSARGPPRGLPNRLLPTHS